MAFPLIRPRRLRKNNALRNWVRETELSPADFVMPFFVRPGKNVRRAISSMPGQYQISIDLLVKEAATAYRLGIPAIILFGIPSRKDAEGSEAYDPDGIVQRAIRAVKDKVPEMIVIADCCFCEYTSHGHCGIVSGKKGELDNDATLEILGRAAAVQAEAGADVIAPSGMADGMVKAIRSALDQHGFSDRIILSYAAKYASSFYSPFRQAAEGAPQFGDRKTYQMDSANAREAMKETALDIKEGADIVMVKPALSYLDIIARVRGEFDVPVAAYNVSGEYSMVKAAARNGWIDEKKAAMEILTSIKRAGADIILTYHAKELAQRW